MDNADRSSDEGVGDGGPIPLLAPASAGEEKQTSALPVLGSAAVLSVSTVPVSSIIEETATKLMEPPAWADFEPGDLLSALPPVEMQPETGSPEIKHSEIFEPEPLEGPTVEKPIERADPAADLTAEKPIERADPAADPYYLSLLNGKR